MHTIDLTDPDGPSPSDFTVHFGIIPDDSYGQAVVAGHDDPRSLAQFVVRHDGHPDIHLDVDGSWHMWGSDDPDVSDEHNNTLHVVFTPSDDETLANQVARAKNWLRVNMGHDDRIYDYALICTSVWSERVATIDVNDYRTTPHMREAQ